jgi:hypothetical protein
MKSLPILIWGITAMDQFSGFDSTPAAFLSPG